MMFQFCFKSKKYYLLQKIMLLLSRFVFKTAHYSLHTISVVCSMHTIQCMNIFGM